MSAQARETEVETDAHGPARSGTAAAAADVRTDATGRAGEAPAAVIQAKKGNAP